MTPLLTLRKQTHLAAAGTLALAAALFYGPAQAADAPASAPTAATKTSSPFRNFITLDPQFGAAFMTWGPLGRQVHQYAGNAQRFVPRFGLAANGYVAKNLRLGLGLNTVSAAASDLKGDDPDNRIHYRGDITTLQTGVTVDYVWKRGKWEVDGGLLVGAAHIRTRVTELRKTPGAPPSFFEDKSATTVGDNQKVWGFGAAPRVTVARVYDDWIAFQGSLDYMLLAMGNGVGLVHGVSVTFGPQFRFMLPKAEGAP